MYIRKSFFWQYILLYLLLIMHGAVVWVLEYSLNYVALCSVGIFALIIGLKYGLQIPHTQLLLAIVFGILFVFSGLFAGESLTKGFNFRTLIQIYLNFLVCYAAIAVDEEKCLTRYIKLLAFFTTISLVGYAICNAGGLSILESVLPSYRYGTSSRTYYGKYFFSILWGRFETDGYTRNIGIYYEPGVHEIVLNSAIFILIFLRKKLLFSDKTVYRMLILFIAALITTKSTTGYIGLFIIFAGAILANNERKLRTKILMIITIFVIGLVVDLIANGENSIISVNLFQKLQEVNVSEGYNYTSGSARIIPVRAAFESIAENPILGIGSSRYERYIESFFGATGGTGNALFGTIASKGLVTTIVLLYLLIKPMTSSGRSKNVVFFFVLMVLNVSFAQGQIAYPSFVFISIAYALQSNKVEKLSLVCEGGGKII